MGIQDRDYYRENSNAFLDAWGRVGAVVWLIVLTAVIFFVQTVMARGAGRELEAIARYSYQKVLSGELWRLVTPIFLHSDLLQLFINMLALYWAGTRLEDRYGGRNLVVFYLLGGLFAQSTFLLAQALEILPKDATTIGSSGAVSAVLVLFALNFAHLKTIPSWLFALLFAGQDLFMAVKLERHGLGYCGVLGGALFAFIYFRSYVGVTLVLAGSRRTAETTRTRPPLRLMPIERVEENPEPVGAAVESSPRSTEGGDEHLEAKVDRLLQKVSQHGKESLTIEEHDLLVKASEIYKKKRK